MSVMWRTPLTGSVDGRHRVISSLRSGVLAVGGWECRGAVSGTPASPADLVRVTCTGDSMFLVHVTLPTDGTSDTMGRSDVRGEGGSIGDS